LLCGSEKPLSVDTPGDPWADTAWVSAIRRLDANRLAYIMAGELASLGLVPFLEQRLAPLLKWVGEEWRRGELEIYQEHFFSQCVSSFLGGQWRRLSDLATGPRVIMLTLPGDRHELGLHMAAAVLASLGARLIFLGVDTPIGEVANVCRSNVVQAVAVSISSQVDPERAISDIRALRGSLPMRAKLLIGGSGAPQNIAGVQSIKQFGELATWCRGEWGTSI
jgi:methylmalonyl-CoA mutase cobalamin-binding subunit